MEAERTKKSRDMEALMMELTAIRNRMKEGIAANARHDVLQPRLMTARDEVLVSHSSNPLPVSESERKRALLAAAI